MFPATSARHLSSVRPRIAYPPTRIRGLRGDSFVRSFPITFVFIIHANDEGRSRNPCRERRIISLSGISSDGQRPPLQKNAKHYLLICACSPAWGLDCVRGIDNPE